MVVPGVQMPGVSGVDVLRRIGETAAQPAVLLGARTRDRDLDFGLAVGEIDSLVNQLSLGTLLHRIPDLAQRQPVLALALRAAVQDCRFGFWMA